MKWTDIPIIIPLSTYKIYICFFVLCIYKYIFVYVIYVLFQCLSLRLDALLLNHLLHCFLCFAAVNFA